MKEKDPITGNKEKEGTIEAKLQGLTELTKQSSGDKSTGDSGDSISSPNNELQTSKQSIQAKEISGLQPRKLNIEMSDKEFELLKVYINEDKVDAFAEYYKQNPDSLSYEDIMTLGLMENFKKSEVLLSTKMLSSLYKNNINPGLFTTLDQSGNNIILYALEKGMCIPKLSGYMFWLNEQNTMGTKFVMEAELIQKVKHALTHPISETHPTLLMEQLIEPLYTKQSIKELTDLIGQDWLDNYYS